MDTHGELPLVPLHPLQVILEQLPHGELAGSGKADELPGAVQEALPRIRAELPPEEGSVDLQRPLRVLQRLAHCLEGAPWSVRSDRSTWASTRFQKDSAGGVRVGGWISDWSWPLPPAFG
jgi:hypothetical protein